MGLSSLSLAMQRHFQQFLEIKLKYTDIVWKVLKIHTREGCSNGLWKNGNYEQPVHGFQIFLVPKSDYLFNSFNFFHELLEVSSELRHRHLPPWVSGFLPVWQKTNKRGPSPTWLWPSFSCCTPSWASWSGCVTVVCFYLNVTSW